MSLQELCRGLESTLTQLDLARRGAHDGAAIDQRLQQWAEKLANLRAIRERATWLQIEPSQVEQYGEQLGYTQQLAEQAVQRLEAMPDIQVLTEEDLWVRLLQTAQKTAETMGRAVEHKWAQQVTQFNRLTPSHQLRATASPLPQNEAPLAEYESNYRAASRLVAMALPKSSGDPEALAQSIDNCKLAAARLRFDAPLEVEDFFRAVNAGGASMTLVTPTVLSWLAENDQLQKFIVRGSTR